MGAKKFTVFIILVGIASLLVAYVNAHDHMAKFGYTGLLGPEKWGSLSPEYLACSNGNIQSPINIEKNNVVRSAKLEPLAREYKPANATLVNNGFNIELRLQGNAGSLLIDGESYILKHMHWHSPSEHTIDGNQYPAELQLVHQSHNGNISIVAILFQFGDPDPFLFQINDHLDRLAKESCEADEEAQIPIGVLRSKQIKQVTQVHFRYVGSLTSPPCTQNVIWNILGKVREMSKEQLAALKAPLHEDYKCNSRPTQPINGRSVELCKSDFY
ncbi:alpha carbonic anhydrase 1, chloroplastic-like [Tasmannia lanceolata]|uniref:alpha carbonic anhydrase 1, chloroplastic-like n=1 Tax=Tasmannia lanceolata TaxID=3420 RepID=UPI00406454DD